MCRRRREKSQHDDDRADRLLPIAEEPRENGDETDHRDGRENQAEWQEKAADDPRRPRGQGKHKAQGQTAAGADRRDTQRRRSRSKIGTRIANEIGEDR